MRGVESQQAVLFSFVEREQRVPADHPLRAMMALVEPVPRELAAPLTALYAAGGRPSIPPEQLLRALLLQVLYTVRSERPLMEPLDCNLLFRWLVGLGIDAPVWPATGFTKHRDRVLAGDVAAACLAGVLRQADVRRLLSHDHFTVDGTLLEAWASHKSFQPTIGAPRWPDDDDPGNPTVHFHSERRSNATHASATDPDSRLAKQGHGKEAKRRDQASVTLDNRHGLVVGTLVGPADGGHTEVEQATTLLTALRAEQSRRAGRRTIGGTRATPNDTSSRWPAVWASPHMARRRTATARGCSMAARPGIRATR